MTNLPRHYAKNDIENAAERVLTLSQPTYHALKRILERQAVETEHRAQAAPDLQQTGPHIRDIEEYHRFFESAQRCFDDQATENT
jgi:DNA-binding ferritin-like protein